MARQNINIGSSANDGTGDPLRTAFDKINDNFIELYGSDNDINTLDANLDVNNYAITTGVTNGDITVTPNGTGNINLGSITINGSTVSANDSTQITIAENIQTTGTLNVTGATTLGGAATLSTSLALSSGATVTSILDEDAMGSDSATALATQQSIKAYVDSQVTAQDLDFACDDSTALSIDLDSESLQFSGGNGITTAGTDNTVTISIDTGTVVTLTDSQTLTNKTLTSPTISSPTITGVTTTTSLTTNDITSNGSNANITINPQGTGTIELGATTNISGSASVSGTLSTADITTTGNQTISGSLTTGTFNVGDLNINADGKISTDTNGNIDLDPSGTGAINLTGPTNVTGTATVTGQLNVDNLRMDGNTLSATSGGLTIDAATGQNITFSKKIIASDADISLIQATTVRADTIQNDTSDGDISISTQGTGNINVNSIKIINLADPTSAQDAATKAYVDSVGGGGGSSSFTFVGDDSTGTVVSSGETFKIAGTQNVTTAVSGDTLTVTGPDLSNYLQNTGTQTIDNISFNDNIISTASNADLNLNPGGTGLVRMLTDKIALGTSAGSTSQGADSVAIGKEAGSSSQGQKSVAIGDEAGTTSQSQYTVAIGRQAGNNTQGEYSVAVGAEAGEVTQGTDSVAIGRQAGYEQGTRSVHIGAFAGGGTGVAPAQRSIGIGYGAGTDGQGIDSIAIGYDAMNDFGADRAIAIGKEASKAGGGQDSIAIGYNAMLSNSTAAYTTAIGYEAARSNTVGGGSDRAIAIGYRAGYATLHPNSIVLNAENAALNTVLGSRFYVAPIRNTAGTTILQYDSSTKEITHSTLTALTLVGDDSTGTTINLGETFKIAGATGVTTAVSDDTLTVTGPDLSNYLQNTGTQTIDNLTFNDNIIGTSSNADLELSPGGTGAVKVTQKLVLDTSQNDGSTVTIDATKPVAILAGNTGTDDLEYTLADGTVAGQTIMLVRGNDPDGNSRESIHVIFSKFNDDGTITTNTNKEIFSQYQSVVTCIWNGSAWCTSKHN